MMQAQRASADVHSWAAAVADAVLLEVQRQAFDLNPDNQLDNSSVAVAALQW
jgi:DNA primase